MEHRVPEKLKLFPSSEADREAVRDQLERMLAHPLFRHSRRYPSLLRYVVEHTLRGDPTELKERTLGVAVFGREPDYDNNADPVVRTTAGEIRKRIAQYYHEGGHDSEIRIDLAAGSYVPEFLPPQPNSTPSPTTLVPALPTASHRPVRILCYAVALVAVALIGALFWMKPWAPRPALDRFWRPVLASPDTALLCVGQRQFLGTSPESAQQNMADLPKPIIGSTGTSTAPPTLFTLYYLGSENVALHDAVTLSRLAGALQARGKAYQIRAQASTSFADLRNRPVVLVGALDNDWTMRLMGQLRFSFERDQSIYWIKDAKSPTDRSRSVSYSMPYRQLSQDYGLISRVLDPTTERMVVVAGGLTGYGTMAAGEFLASPAYMEELARSAPRDWDTKNMQIVIATKVIDGVSGPPRVLYSYFW